MNYTKNKGTGTFLAVQGLKLCAPSSGGLGLVPGEGTRPCMLQLRSSTAKYINKYFLRKPTKVLTAQNT